MGTIAVTGATLSASDRHRNGADRKAGHAMPAWLPCGMLTGNCCGAAYMKSRKWKRKESMMIRNERRGVLRRAFDNFIEVRSRQAQRLVEQYNQKIERR